MKSQNFQSKNIKHFCFFLFFLFFCINIYAKSLYFYFFMVFYSKLRILLKKETDAPPFFQPYPAFK